MDVGEVNWIYHYCPGLWWVMDGMKRIGIYIQ